MHKRITIYIAVIIFIVLLSSCNDTNKYRVSTDKTAYVYPLDISTDKKYRAEMLLDAAASNDKFNIENLREKYLFEKIPAGSDISILHKKQVGTGYSYIIKYKSKKYYARLHSFLNSDKYNKFKKIVPKK